MILQSTGNQRKAGTAILGKTRLWVKNGLKEKEGHFVMIRRSIHQDITVINIYVPNIWETKYIE